MKRMISVLLILMLASSCAARKDIEAPTATTQTAVQGATLGAAAPAVGAGQEESGTAIILGSIAAIVLVGAIIAAAVAGDGSGDFSSEP